MSRLYLSLGSNIQAPVNIRCAVTALRRLFDVVSVSPVYESVSVGFKGANFLNLAMLARTALDPHSVVEALRALEDVHQRDRNAPHFSGRTLDVDLLFYDNLILHSTQLQLPRPDVLRHAFVLAPLADIGASEICAPFTKTLRQLWEDYPGERDTLWPVRIQMDGDVPELSALARPIHD